MDYWLCLFTGTSWMEFLNAELPEVGFNEKQLKQAQKIKEGDRLIAYLTKVSRFVGILEVTREAEVSYETKWTEGTFPVRVGARVLTKSSIPDAVPLPALLGKLSFLQYDEMPVSGVWSAHVRSSPRHWKPEDGRTIERALKRSLSSDAKTRRKANPVSSVKLERKRGKFKNLNRVGKLIKRSKEFVKNGSDLPDEGKILSRNQVTGYAVNFPIHLTCRPTEVCRETCYFSVKLNASTSALHLQHRNLKFCQRDPEGFAAQVIREYDNAGVSFLRWNGGGDLFEESLAAIEYIRVRRPEIILWIVSRKPDYASKIRPHKNHYIHISLDRTSIASKVQIRSMFNDQQVFFSYQAYPDEELAQETVEEADLIFMHDYVDVPKEYKNKYVEKFCPLNGALSITDACGECQRCFDGSLSVSV
ncbi:EVE domain-containing protein [Alphaproteobacteria bacterium]|nr:EVE domain-containing protein [Alphaproteobacteria bacterium]